MSSNLPYAGTILADTYNPIVFRVSQRIAQEHVPAISDGDKAIESRAIVKGSIAAVATVIGAASAPISIPAVLVASVTAGLAGAFVSQKKEEVETEFLADDYLRATAGIIGGLVALPSLWEAFFKKRALRDLQETYNKFLNQIEKDYVSYCACHEDQIQQSLSTVDDINRRKVIMKDYLLFELSEQLKRSGLEGTFNDPVIERLDPRDWPINEKYDLIKEGKHKLESLGQEYLGLFSHSFFLISAISNRVKIRRLKNAMAKLEPMADYNLEQMLADLEKLEVFSAALENIDKIYTEVLENLRPKMRAILKDLEDKYQGNVDKMPPSQADALYTLKTLFKDLAEITIIPRSKDQSGIVDDVCDYSDSLSQRYIQIRETIYYNFCN